MVLLTPMKTNLDFTHPRLVENKKLTLIEKYVVKGFEIHHI